MTWEAEAALQGPGKEGARAEATRGVAGSSEPPPRMRRDRHQAGGAGAAVAAVAAVAAAAAKAADQEGEGVATSGERPQQALVALRIQGPSESWEQGVAWPMMPDEEGQGERSCPCAWQGSR